MPAYVSGTLTGTGSVTLTKVSRARFATFTHSGAYTTTTFVFEVSADGTNWAPASAVLVSTSALANGTISPTNGTTVSYQVLCPDVQFVRARVTAIASNSITFVGVSDDLSNPLNTPVAFAIAGASGAVSLKNGVVYVTLGSAAALTLAAPVAGVDDGVLLTVVSTTAFAHTLTQTTPGFNNGGAASDVATFGAAAGNSISVRAYNGVWWVTNLQGVTLA